MVSSQRFAPPYLRSPATPPSAIAGRGLPRSVQELLSCPSGEESDILQRHSNLVDEGLVWVMVQVAERMAEAGNPNAYCLRRFTAQLAQLIGNWKQLYQRATQLYHQGQYSQAVIVAEQALALARQLWEDEHLNTVASLNNLALLYHLQGCLAAAESLYKAAFVMIKRLFPTDHPDVAQSLNNLAGLYQSQGCLAVAEPLCEEALAMNKRLFPTDHPNVAQSLNNLAALYRLQGRLSAAKPLLEEVLAMNKRLFPQDHPRIATSLNNLAGLYHL